MVFSDLNAVRAHFQTDHPGTEVKFKRGKPQGAIDGKIDEKKGKGRRIKSTPSRSLANSVNANHGGVIVQ